jgi:putative FmdB family regulatory protein
MKSMPTYEFFCQKCGKEFSLIMSMKERETEKIKCSHCGADEVTQQLSAVITKTSRKS